MSNLTNLVARIREETKEHVVTCLKTERLNNLLVIIEKQNEALKYYAGEAFEESNYLAISSNFKSNYLAKKALSECEELAKHE